jgi:hypothetical protein
MVDQRNLRTTLCSDGVLCFPRPKKSFLRPKKDSDLSKLAQIQVSYSWTEELIQNILANVSYLNLPGRSNARAFN